MKPIVVYVAMASTALVLNLAFSCKVTSAAPLTYQLFQVGWEGGGEVRGLFSGEDLNNDEFLTLADGEISSYMIEFSGNAIVPSFTHDLSDLMFFAYELGSSGFPPSFPLFSDNGSFFYDADDRIIGGSGFVEPFITTLQPAVVNVIPEPATLVLLVVGLACLFWCNRTRPKSPRT